MGRTGKGRTLMEHDKTYLGLYLAEWAILAALVVAILLTVYRTAFE